MLQALHQRVLHKTFQELTPPIPYIPKSLAWSVKGHGLPQLALTASLLMAMDTLTAQRLLFRVQVLIFYLFGISNNILTFDVFQCMHAG